MNQPKGHDSFFICHDFLSVCPYLQQASSPDFTKTSLSTAWHGPTLRSPLVYLHSFYAVYQVGSQDMDLESNTQKDVLKGSS